MTAFEDVVLDEQTFGNFQEYKIAMHTLNSSKIMFMILTTSLLILKM